MPNRYVLTGAPGSGKTTLLRALAERGRAVIDEAATDVIATMQAHGVDEPWTRGDFCDRVVALQRQRQTALPAPEVELQFFDRSPICTLALARYLGRPEAGLLAEEVIRVVEHQVYERTVFLVRPLGAVERTAARRISYSDALAFEAMHEEAYREHGYELIEIPAGPVAERAALVLSLVGIS
jgi:predicted ATPase